MDDQMSLTCPICLNLLNEPVTIPCGHNYCKGCITDCWDHDQGAEGDRCPQCRETFHPRPSLKKNTLVAEMVEKLKLTVNTTASGFEDVECDVCVDRKLKAVKSCLVCLASYCETHVQPHYQAPAFKNHTLVDATKRLQEQICSQHQKPLEMYCHTDQTCICILCTMDNHRNHKTFTAATYRNEKQKHLQNTNAKFLRKISERDVELQKMRNAVEFYKSSADTAVEGVNQVFTELISFLEEKRSAVAEMIRDQERTAVKEAEDLLKELEEEIADLKKTNGDIEELLQTEDNIHFIRSFQSVSAPTESASTFTLSPFNTFDDVMKSVLELKDELVDFSVLTIDRISKEAKAVDIVEQPEPETREDFLKHSCKLNLDHNTTNGHLRVSNGNKEITYDKEMKWYTDHLERFLEYEQVLCRESLAGRCYWEVEWRGKTGVSIAVAYKQVNRAHYCSLFGRDQNSWRLKLTEKHVQFSHEDSNVDVFKGPVCSKVGVYLDYKAGTLSFYKVTDNMTLIHRVQANFKEPLYPGFKLNRDTYLKICDP